MSQTKEIEDLIIKVVESSQGIKAVDLTIKVISEIIPRDINNLDVLGVLQDLVLRGELVEIEYSLPQMSYRTKSFFLPKGSKILS